MRPLFRGVDGRLRALHPRGGAEDGRGERSDGGGGPVDPLFRGLDGGGGRVDPQRGALCPREGRSHPREGRQLPFRGSNHPRRGREESPRGKPPSPRGRRESPRGTLPSPSGTEPSLSRARRSQERAPPKKEREPTFPQGGRRMYRAGIPAQPWVPRAHKSLKINIRRRTAWERRSGGAPARQRSPGGVARGNGASGPVREWRSRPESPGWPAGSFRSWPPARRACPSRSRRRSRPAAPWRSARG
jgi:hypothetical protein